MKVLIISFILVVFAFGVHSAETGKNVGWALNQCDAGPPRGGNTEGPEVEYDNDVPSSWKDRKNSQMTAYEKDRHAIKAMTGTYKSRFEFIETILMDTVKPKDRPYATWGTEFVKVIEDRGDFISLQHIMVMYIVEEGKTQGPYVVKHWRQDWQWEGKEQLIFHGDRKWSRQSIPKSKGKWVWTVYQVDDSPRYSGVGSWNHFESASVFETNYMSRPLPRREFSVRSDYKLLMAKESLIITPEGWHHEQRNFKHKGSLQNNQFNGTFLAREVGHNSYRRIKNFNITAGEEYWENSQNYWKDVRVVWNKIFQDHQMVTLRGKVDDLPLYKRHFDQAIDADILKMSSQERQKLIRKTIEMYLQ